MQFARPANSMHPRRFGRGPIRSIGSDVPTRPRPLFSDDLKLFATTFAAGFIFVSVLFA